MVPPSSGQPSAALPRSGQAAGWEGRLRDPVMGAGLIYSTCLGWRRRCRWQGSAGFMAVGWEMRPWIGIMFGNIRAMPSRGGNSGTFIVHKKKCDSSPRPPERPAAPVKVSPVRTGRASRTEQGCSL